MLQGARHEHAEALYNAAMELSVDIDVIPLRSEINNHDLKLDGLVLPGGESTTMRKASENHGLLSSIFTFIDNNPSIPILGTCAGAILLMDPKMGKEPYVDAKVDRNAYGRQKDSFEKDIRMENNKIFKGVFIRAPAITSIGNKTKPIAWADDDIVGCIEGKNMALTFHPELTNDLTFHKLWLERLK